MMAQACNHSTGEGETARSLGSTGQSAYPICNRPTALMRDHDSKIKTKQTEKQKPKTKTRWGWRYD